MSHLTLKRLTTKQRQTYDAVVERLQRQKTVTGHHLALDLKLDRNTACARLAKLVKLKLLTVNTEEALFTYKLKES